MSGIRLESKAENGNIEKVCINKVLYEYLKDYNYQLILNAMQSTQSNYKNKHKTN